MSFVTRFAPSPTGLLHLGHAFSVLTAFRAARAASGRFLLRIEDTDWNRCKPEFEAAIFEDLEWLGIEWDAPPLKQSERRDRYETRLQTLIDRGVVYRCFRSRKELEELQLSAPHGDMPGPFRSEALSKLEERARLAEGRPFAWRLSIEGVGRALGRSLDADVARFEGTVLGRKDIGTSYHLASVHDDAASGVTHVIRGDDLREAEDLHRLLFELFDAEPPEFQHHRLILNEHGHRLSKRDKSTALRELRARGQRPEDIVEQLGLD